MATSVNATLDQLRLAWRRYKLDREAERAFVTHPYLIEWIDLDRDVWLNAIKTRLAEGYEPSPGRPCFAPKSSYLLRAGLILSPEDEVVYNLLVGRLLPDILRLISPLQGDPDLGYQLQKRASTPKWTKDRYESWRQFRLLSVDELETHPFVVVADITGFYDNIDLDRLTSDLRSAAPSQEAEIELLQACLRKWALPRGKGIPQGHSASDILAKLYLQTLDLDLSKRFRHLRYVDDMRIFCRCTLEARLALRRLVEVLHRRGLSVQSAKTRIIPASDARPLFDGIVPTIDRIHRELREELEKELKEEGPYMDEDRAATLLGRGPGPPVAVLERAFSEYFASAGSLRFEPSLFHYLLNRLGIAGSQVAVGYCIDTLRSRPEETSSIMRYLMRLELGAAEVDRVLAYAGSADAIYDYQLYQIVKAFYENRRCHHSLLELSRGWSRDSNCDPWLRTYAVAYTALFGDPADLEYLEERYSSLIDIVERAEVVMAIRRQEKRRRNAFYGRVKGEGELVARAIRFVRSRDDVSATTPQ